MCTVRVEDGWYLLNDWLITRREGVGDLGDDAVVLLYERLPDLLATGQEIIPRPMGDSRTGQALAHLLERCSGSCSSSKAGNGDHCA
jgi:hypothetical protein